MFGTSLSHQGGLSANLNGKKALFGYSAWSRTEEAPEGSRLTGAGGSENADAPARF